MYHNCITRPPPFPNLSESTPKDQEIDKRKIELGEIFVNRQKERALLASPRKSTVQLNRDKAAALPTLKKTPLNPSKKTIRSRLKKRATIIRLRKKKETGSEIKRGVPKRRLSSQFKKSLSFSAVDKKLDERDFNEILIKTEQWMQTKIDSVQLEVEPFAEDRKIIDFIKAPEAIFEKFKKINRESDTEQLQKFCDRTNFFQYFNRQEQKILEERYHLIVYKGIDFSRSSEVYLYITTFSNWMSQHQQYVLRNKIDDYVLRFLAIKSLLKSGEMYENTVDFINIIEEIRDVILKPPTPWYKDK